MGSFFGQNLGIWPPRVAIYRVTPTVMQLILKNYHHSLFWIFLVYFVLLNGPNWGVIYIIPIFGVVFGQNLGIWPPGMAIYRVNPHCYPTIFEEISSCSIENVDLWISSNIKVGKIDHIWDIRFLSDFDPKNASFGPHFA